MKVLWVILNEAKDAVVEMFETDSPDSSFYWDKFFDHRPGCVFCGRVPANWNRNRSREWYFNYFFWDDMTRWGYDDPDGIAWSAAMTLPEPIKLLVMLEDSA